MASFSFDTDKLGPLLRETTQILTDAGHDAPALDARLLLCHACEVSYEMLLADPDRQTSDAQIALLTEFTQRRLDHEPVSRIMGYRAFWKHDFKINHATLDPRPDTETLIEATLDYVDGEKGRNFPFKILDLGTGSGCILLSLLSELPNATGVGVDISEEALEIAGHNADEISVFDQVRFIKSNWLDSVNGAFDIIVSNPPYIVQEDIQALMRDVRDYDPYTALDGGQDGLDAYRIIINQIAQSPEFKQSWIIFEIGDGQAEDVQNLLKNHISQSFFDINSKADLSGRLRCVSARFENTAQL